MKIILTQNVAGVGDKGEAKEVKPGFARNYLLPRGLAVEADSNGAKKLLLIKEKNQEEKAEASGKIKDILAQNQGLELAFIRKARGDRLFGSVKQAEILDQIEKTIGIRPDKLDPDKPIKKVGNFEIAAEFSQGGKLIFDLRVEAEK